ncbi:MAG TPA: hypothetical protein VJY12_04785, partial [Dysgonamonadaceae bacterium]|nr:hypothetical protein [Dysgonamonadaceae bacterium]
MPGTIAIKNNNMSITYDTSSQLTRPQVLFNLNSHIQEILKESNLKKTSPTNLIQVNAGKETKKSTREVRIISLDDISINKKIAVNVVYESDYILFTSDEYDVFGYGSSFEEAEQMLKDDFKILKEYVSEGII